MNSRLPRSKLPDPLTPDPSPARGEGAQAARLAWLVIIAWLLPGVPARAEFDFAKTTVNLGKVKSGVTLTQEFAFAVSGSEPVEILEVRPGCGCVQSDLKQKSFAPGEKGALVLKVNTLGEAAGAHRWYLYIFYQQGEQKGQLVLQILAEVDTEVNVQPGRLSIHAAGPITHELLLTDVRAQLLTILDVRATPAALRAVAEKPFRDGQGRWNVKIKVTAGADVPEGRTEGMVSIYTEDAEYRHLQIPVTVTRPAAQRYHANPAEVKLYGEAGRPLPARLVLIRDGRDEPVEIAQIKSDHPAVQCKWAKGPGQLATVRIQIDAGKIEDQQLKTAVHIETGGKQRETLVIPVTCILD